MSRLNGFLKKILDLGPETPRKYTEGQISAEPLASAEHRRPQKIGITVLFWETGSFSELTQGLALEASTDGCRTIIAGGSNRLSLFGDFSGLRSPSYVLLFAIRLLYIKVSRFASKCERWPIALTLFETLFTKLFGYCFSRFGLTIIFTFDVGERLFFLLAAAKNMGCRTVAAQHGHLASYRSFYEPAKYCDRFLVWENSLKTQWQAQGFLNTCSVPPLYVPTFGKSGRNSGGLAERNQLLVVLGRVASEQDQDSPQLLISDYEAAASLILSLGHWSQNPVRKIIVRAHPGDFVGLALQPFENIDGVIFDTVEQRISVNPEGLIAVVVFHSTIALEAINLGIPVVELVTPSRLEVHGLKSMYKPSSLLRTVSDMSGFWAAITWASTDFTSIAAGPEPPFTNWVEAILR